MGGGGGVIAHADSEFFRSLEQPFLLCPPTTTAALWLFFLAVRWSCWQENPPHPAQPWPRYRLVGEVGVSTVLVVLVGGGSLGPCCLGKRREEVAGCAVPSPRHLSPEKPRPCCQNLKTGPGSVGREHLKPETCLLP